MCSTHNNVLLKTNFETPVCKSTKKDFMVHMRYKISYEFGLVQYFTSGTQFLFPNLKQHFKNHSTKNFFSI